MGPRRKHESDSEESDQEVSQEILDRLNAYGNSLIPDDEDRKSRAKRSKTKSSINASSGKINGVTDSQTDNKKKRKKKKKTATGSEDFDEDDDDDFPVKLTQVDKLKNMLFLTDEEITKLKEKKLKKENKSKGDKTLDPVVTDANRLKQKKRPPPEVVVFNDPAKRAKKAKPMKVVGREEMTETEDDTVYFDLKQARWEVRKMAITALDKQEKEEAHVDLAVKLGAVRPKNKCMNYKDLTEKRKKEKKEEEDKKELMRKLGYKVPKTVDTKRRKRDINEVGRLDGQIGKYEFGVQKVSQHDMAKLSKPKSNKQRGKR